MTIILKQNCAAHCTVSSSAYQSVTAALPGSYRSLRIKLMNSKDQPQEKQKRQGWAGQGWAGEGREIISILCLMKLIHNSTTQSKIAVQAVNHVLLTNECYLPLRTDLHFPFKFISLKQIVPLSNRLDKRTIKQLNCNRFHFTLSC